MGKTDAVNNTRNGKIKSQAQKNNVDLSKEKQKNVINIESGPEIDPYKPSQFRIECASINRENAVHKAFAESRVSDFVYAETKDYYRVLDDYCSDESFKIQTQPFVVIGPAGCGKTSMLANWVHKRRANDPGEYTAVISTHYAGCSYDSVKLSHFLYGILHKLKISFGLHDFELPNEHEEEKLKFSLVRCLEAAMSSNSLGQVDEPVIKTRRFILILDGVDNIRTEDGAETLAWLPYEFPLGVKIILSATDPSEKPGIKNCGSVVRRTFEYDSDDDIVFNNIMQPDADDPHIIRELKRRKCPILLLEPLDEPSCREIIQKYFSKYKDEMLWAHSRIEDIVSSHGSSSPLYLRLILEKTKEADPSRQNSLLTELLQTNEILDTYEVILNEWSSILLKALDQQYHETSPNQKENEDLQKRKKTKNPLLPPPTAEAAPSAPSALLDKTKYNLAKQQRLLLARHALSLFVTSRYGLSEKDFNQLLEDSADANTRDLMFSLLRPHLLQIHRIDCSEVLYDLSHNHLRLITRYCFLKDDTLRFNYHKEHANYFSSIPAIQRRVDELPVHLEYCNSWSSLLNVLMDIKMFKLWWNERNREDFIAYWLALRSHHSGHDPVDEFIHSLDEFIHTESPSMNELLHIIILITEFFQRWAKLDDETSKPEFNRPEPPRLSDLLMNHGPFSSIKFDSQEVKNIIDHLSAKPNDSYYVKRWLWAQFPLIATSFKGHFLKPLMDQIYVEHRTISSSHSSTSSHHTTKETFCSNPTLNHRYNSFQQPYLQKVDNCPPGLVTQSSLRDTKQLIVPSSSKTNLTSPSKSKLSSDSFEFLSEAQDESTISVPYLKNEIRHIRSQLDKLRFESMEKTAIVQALDSKLLDAKADASLRIAGNKKKDDMHERMQNAIIKTAEERQIRLYFQHILRQCEMKPAKDPNIIEESESLISKLKQDISDLQQKTLLLGYEQKLESIEIPKLMEAIEDREKVHEEALSRLRWRSVQLKRQHNWELKFRLKSREMQRLAEGDLGIQDEGKAMNHVNSLLEQSKKIEQNKVNKLDDLKQFQGSIHQDDGLIGILRKAGIHEPSEVLTRWQDQNKHAQQLQAEAKACENKIHELQTVLETTIQHLQELKLEADDNNKSSPLNKQENLISHEVKDSKNQSLKYIEQQIREAKRTLQEKITRTERLAKLTENMRLGILHIAEVLSIEKTNEYDTITLLKTIEKYLRKLDGDETMVTVSSGSLRKNVGDDQSTKNQSQRKLFNIRVRSRKYKKDEVEEKDELEDLTYEDDAKEIREHIKNAAKTETEKRRQINRKLESQKHKGEKTKGDIKGDMDVDG